MAKSALIAGASGLVGSALVRLLLKKKYYHKIVVLTRRELLLDDDRVEQLIVQDFDKLEEYTSQMNAHDFYVALGTTRKKAGSKEAFLKIDRDYPLALANIALKQPDFEQFLVVSSYGANPNSPLFYNMTKGKLEEDLIKLNMKGLKIFQPSLLIGKRSEFRIWEEIAKGFARFLSFFVIGSKRQLWMIKSDDVALAMYRAARKGSPGIKKYKPSKMLKIAYS